MSWYADLTLRRISSEVSFSCGPLCERILSGFQIVLGEASTSLRRGTAFLLNSLLRGGGFLFGLALLMLVVGLIALGRKSKPPRWPDCCTCVCCCCCCFGGSNFPG